MLFKYWGIIYSVAIVSSVQQSDSVIHIYEPGFPILSNSATPWTVACQAPLSMGFSMQEYKSGLSFSSAGDHAGPGIKVPSPVFPALVRRLFTEPLGNTYNIYIYIYTLYIYIYNVYVYICSLFI